MGQTLHITTDGRATAYQHQFKHPEPMNLSPFELKLIQCQYASVEQLQTAHALHKKKSWESFLDILETVAETPLPPALRNHYRDTQRFSAKIFYGIEPIDLSQSTFSLEEMVELIEKVLPISICREYSVIPLNRQETDPHSLRVGLVDPSNVLALDRVNRALKHHDLIAEPAFITREDFQQLIQFFFDNSSSLRIFPRNVEVDFDLSFDLDCLDLLHRETNEQDLAQPLHNAEAEPIVTLMNKIIVKAAIEGAKEIYIEPRQENLRIRFRDEHSLYYAFPPLPKAIAPSVASRCKILANLDIAKTTTPQQGHYQSRVSGLKIDFLIHTAPTLYGETVVIKLFRSSLVSFRPQSIAEDPECLESMKRLTQKPTGLLVFSDSQDTSDLMPLIVSLLEPSLTHLSIRTIEEAIAYRFPNLLQTEIHHQSRMDFPTCIRSIQTQHPDVIILSDLPDRSTAIAALNAAQSSLVIVALTMKGARNTLSYLQDLQLPPLALSRSLLGIISRQQVPQLCAHCRVPYPPQEAEFTRFATLLPDLQVNQERTWYKATRNVGTDSDRENQCPYCRGRGYDGYISLFEILEVTDDISMQLANSTLPVSLSEIISSSGMTSFREQYLPLLDQGKTTVESMNRLR